MKMLKKLGIFLLVTVLLSSLFSIGVFADETDTGVADGTETNEIIYFAVDNLRVSCPECDSQGLVLKKDDDGEFFVCQNKECGYAYIIECSFCDGNDFVGMETAESELLYSCTKCHSALTLTEVQGNLKIAKKPSGGKLDMSLKPEGFDERLGYALQGTVTGMLMVFSVLALLALIVSLSKVIFYTIPNRKAEKKMKARESANPNSIASAEPVAPVVNNTPAPAAAPAPVAQASDDGELAAVITAAVAAMIESGDYKNEFVGGFRVVSFKRSTQSAWNRK